MEKYISRKEVLAEPMDEAQAVELGYARPNEDNHEWRQGYHVLYPDGYHSWCPKKQFEESNRCAETFLNRLSIEIDDLKERIKSLKSFMYTEKFNSLEPAQRICMERQLGSMSSYDSILEERIRLILSSQPCGELANCACD
jgi:hypothetical protein